MFAPPKPLHLRSASPFPLQFSLSWLYSIHEHIIFTIPAHEHTNRRMAKCKTEGMASQTNATHTFLPNVEPLRSRQQGSPATSHKIRMKDKL